MQSTHLISAAVTCTLSLCALIYTDQKQCCAHILLCNILLWQIFSFTLEPKDGMFGGPCRLWYFQLDFETSFIFVVLHLHYK